MKTLCVLQHIEAEYLGLMEDHFESRNIRFHYCRPFTPGGTVPADGRGFDGLVMLGAGPYGIVSGHLIPSLGPELRLTADFLAPPPAGSRHRGWRLHPRRRGRRRRRRSAAAFRRGTARRVGPHALAGHLPQAFPVAVYMRDRPVLPSDARVLAVGDCGRAAGVPDA